MEERLIAVLLLDVSKEADYQWEKTAKSNQKTRGMLS